MRFIKVFFSVLGAFLFSFQSCNENKNAPEDSTRYLQQEVTDNAGNTYETIPNDPTGLRLYTLTNGLKVYLSKNDDEPTIQTFIAVRAGSNYDPKESTGLAHYLEHMLFKGTSKIGTQDFEKEKVFLKELSDLFEAHKNEKDGYQKKAIYEKIDKVSQEASKIAIPNEYDKMLNSIGASGTNAHTWFEETIYKNKIPSNELEKWLTVEKERFSELVLRLFHTELEAVYEEFNRGQDSDYRKEFAAMMMGLFPKHPYGQQTTIGTSEHLKNPSMKAIHNYFNTYYVPNNMALVLVGDLDFDETIKKVKNTFGSLPKKEVKHPELPKEAPLTKVIQKEVYGPSAERLKIAFRAAAIGDKDEQLLTLCDMLLANGKAGLLDLNLNQQQQVQYAGCSPTFLNDYGFHSFNGTPKSGQTLEAVEKLILAEIDKLKKGMFEDWMLAAVINDLELRQTKEYESSTAVAKAYYHAFIHHQSWQKRLSFIAELRTISKSELVAFANKFYGNNYVVVYKRQGKDAHMVKVEKPRITPVALNRDKSSAFFQDLLAVPEKELKPKFVDYNSAIEKLSLDNGISLSFVKNERNELFELDFIFDFGKNHDLKTYLAAGYLDFLGTDRYSAEQIQQEFYKLGVSYRVVVGGDITRIHLAGLSRNLEKGLELLEHLLDNAKANPLTYQKYVEKISKQREDTRTDKYAILWKGLLSYSRYGKDSGLRNNITVNELKAIDPEELVKKIKGIKEYKQRVFYYGKDSAIARNAINKLHQVSLPLKAYPEEKKYVEKETGGKVYFTNFDMVQSELLFYAKGEKFDSSKMPAAGLFNEYFGGGLSSIVFQEIRESKSLAYSAFSGYANGRKPYNNDYVYAYIGTQANKLPAAVNAMSDLMNAMPEVPIQFEQTKRSTLKKMAAKRITKSAIFWTAESLREKGLPMDHDKNTYEAISKMSLTDLKTFFNNNIKGEKYSLMVIGNKKDMDMKALNRMGIVEELTVDFLFNFDQSKTTLEKE